VAKDFAILCRIGGTVAEDFATHSCANDRVAKGFAILCHPDGAVAEVICCADE
jgi:hypothetical protein